MGYRINEDIEPRLLLFFRQNAYCNNYFARHLTKFKEWIFFFNMDIPSDKDIEAAQIYKIVSVPTLILLNKDRHEDLRWVGGIGPDANLLSIEMGMEKAWWQENDEQK